ncbi:MAG TPA: hypothetical protein VD996_11365 [Chitinophagaceae bacterium]|nr:hypothetical protein [Chitinophagaceae bacterium]
MKKQLFPLFASIVLMMACNNAANKQEAENKTEEEKTESSDASTSGGGILSAANETEKRVEELKKLPPVSNETLKSYFPEEVMGMKRSSFNVSSAMGYAAGTAEYRKNDTTEYSVAIYDCAGEAGAGFYSMSWLAGMNMESENDNGYQKTVSFMGNKAIEGYSKSNHEHTLSFLSGERFWVTIEGNEGLDNLKAFADRLGLGKLKAN